MHFKNPRMKLVQILAMKFEISRNASNEKGCAFWSSDFHLFIENLWSEFG
jgi:hypothetical protein